MNSSRYNPALTFEQYQVLLERKRIARANLERVRYKDLAEAWGVHHYYLATAVSRGIKQYDYKIWKSGKENSLPGVQP